MRILGTRLLVAPIAAKLLSVGGLHLVGQYVDHSKLYRVLDVGPSVNEIRIGDAVFVPEYGYRPDIGDGRMIIEQKEAIAVIREE